MQWEWYQDSHMVHLFLHLLLSANHKEGRWKGQVIKRGQLITGRKKLSVDTKLSQRSIRTCLEKLKTTNEITIHSTNKNSLITICKYDDYALKKNFSTSKMTNKMTIDRPANDQQTTTNNNVNNDNNILVRNREQKIKKFSEWKVGNQGIGE